ncbi:THAP domain-containing protein [Phthorimaea operculella]|nr:THAP domain-containing protein [Phthorimaea operculella]
MYCNYFMCKNFSLTKSMFRFPVKNSLILTQWLNNCGNLALHSLPPEKLRHRYICIDHFHPKYVYNIHGKQKRIRKMAIPEHFQANSDGKKNQEADSTPKDQVPDMIECTQWPESSKPRVYKNKKQNNSTEQNAISKTKTINAKSWRSTIKKHKLDKENAHPGIHCSNCQKRIRGFRYTCVQCVDVELCRACDARGAHAGNYILRIPRKRNRSEVEKVLRQVREAVAIVLRSRKKPDIYEPKLIKPEPIDEPTETDPLQDASYQLKVKSEGEEFTSEVEEMDEGVVNVTSEDEDVTLEGKEVTSDVEEMAEEVGNIKSEGEEVTSEVEEMVEEVGNVTLGDEEVTLKDEEVTLEVEETDEEVGNIKSEGKVTLEGEEVTSEVEEMDEEVGNTSVVPEIASQVQEDTFAENTVLDFYYRPESISSPPAAKRRRVCRARTTRTARTAHSANSAHSAHTERAIESSFVVMSHKLRAIQR